MLAVKDSHTWPILATDVPQTLYYKICTLYSVQRHLRSLFGDASSRRDLLASFRHSPNSQRCVKTIENNRYVMSCVVQALGGPLVPAQISSSYFFCQTSDAIRRSSGQRASPARQEEQTVHHGRCASRTPRPHVAGYALDQMEQANVLPWRADDIRLQPRRLNKSRAHSKEPVNGFPLQ